MTPGFNEYATSVNALWENVRNGADVAEAAQDCVDELAGRGFYGPWGEKTTVCNEEKLCYYVRGNSDAWLEANKKDSWGNAVITGPVTVAEAHTWLKNHPEAFLAAIAK